MFTYNISCKPADLNAEIQLCKVPGDNKKQSPYLELGLLGFAIGVIGVLFMMGFMLGYVWDRRFLLAPVW